MSNVKEFKKLVWSGDDPKTHITSYTKIIANFQLGYRITTVAGGSLMLMEYIGNARTNRYDIESVDQGKQLAQTMFDAHCKDILRNIYGE